MSIVQRLGIRMEPEDREMSLYEFVTHSSVGSYLSLVMLRLQPNNGFNLMSFCYCSPDTVPIEKELMVPALKGIPVQRRRQGCVNQQIQHNMVDVRIR